MVKVTLSGKCVASSQIVFFFWTITAAIYYIEGVLKSVLVIIQFSDLSDYVDYRHLIGQEGSLQSAK